MVTRRKRYRSSNGQICIDLNLRHINQLFNSLDPSPFLERDLDDDAVDYIVNAALEHSLRAPVALIIHIADPEQFTVDSKTVVEAVHNHFAYSAELAQKKIRRILRQGQFALVMGIVLLFSCLTIAHGMQAPAIASYLAVMREGLIILGWVAMWRPIDVFLYSWWPQVEMRQLFVKLSHVPIEIKMVTKHKSDTSLV